MGTMHRARAVLNIDRRITAQVLGTAKRLDKGLGDHPALFLAPSPPLLVLEAQIVVVDKLEVAVAGGGEKASVRNVQRDILVGMMDSERLYIQSVADTSSTPEQAASTIELGGLTVAGVTRYTKAILTVRQAPEPGTVTLDAYAAAIGGKRGRQRFFNWQFTGDGGETFVDLPSTPTSKTLVTNLTPLSVYGFRVSVTNSAGVRGEWSQIVAFLVH